MLEQAIPALPQQRERLVIVADVVVDMQAAVIRRRNDVLIGHLEESLIPLREIVVYRNVVLGSAPVIDLDGTSVGTQRAHGFPNDRSILRPVVADDIVAHLLMVRAEPDGDRSPTPLLESARTVVQIVSFDKGILPIALDTHAAVGEFAAADHTVTRRRVDHDGPQLPHIDKGTDPVAVRNLCERVREGQLSDVKIVAPQADAIPETGRVRIGEQRRREAFAAIARKADRSRGTPRCVNLQTAVEAAAPGKRHDVARLQATARESFERPPCPARRGAVLRVVTRPGVDPEIPGCGHAAPARQTTE